MPKGVYDWLVTVTEYNRSPGVDSSAVQFDAAGKTRSMRIQEKSLDVVAAAAPSQTGKIGPRFKGATLVGGWAAQSPRAR